MKLWLKQKWTWQVFVLLGILTLALTATATAWVYSSVSPDTLHCESNNIFFFNLHTIKDAKFLSATQGLESVLVVRLLALF